MASATMTASLSAVTKGLHARSVFAGRVNRSPVGLPPLRHRAGLSVRAAAGRPAAGGVAAFSESIGLPVDEGIFGFGPFAEQWQGRLAMVGFTTGLMQEVWTGDGILRQIGLDGSAMGWVLAGFIVTATLSASLSTVLRASAGQMAPRELGRWQAFLRLDDEAVERVAAMRMKDEGDFTSLDCDAARIAAARDAGMPADAVLSMSDGDATWEEKDAAPPSELETMANGLMANPEAEARAAGAPEACWVDFDSKSPVDNYGHQVELMNGRAAMLGFAVAVTVEGFTGMGIIPQLISIGKASGLLGPLSGF